MSRTVTDSRGSLLYLNDNGKLHREGGPAIIRRDQYQAWYQNGILHREDGPAVVFKKYQSWYNNGERHRADGPAVVYGDGTLVYYTHNIYQYITKG